MESISQVAAVPVPTIYPYAYIEDGRLIVVTEEADEWPISEIEIEFHRNGEVLWKKSLPRFPWNCVCFVVNLPSDLGRLGLDGEVEVSRLLTRLEWGLGFWLWVYLRCCAGINKLTVRI
ncbi:hypothetical protein KGM48_00170 [Patescibacteria group bacterium]|nr:hypothetical protein [Patescibacteria group bacterium]